MSLDAVLARIDADRPREDVWRDVLGACQRAGYLPPEAP